MDNKIEFKTTFGNYITRYFAGIGALLGMLFAFSIHPLLLGREFMLFDVMKKFFLVI